ncbi:MAG: hypothetical protein ACON35_06000 [Candidatus Marinamargulisbacteria bacterium]
MLLKTISSSPNNQNSVNNNHSFECAVVTGAALATAIGLFTPRSYWFLIGGVVPLLERIMTVGQRCYLGNNKDLRGV